MSNNTCNRYNSYIITNETTFKISTAYEGIPQNFAINISAYIVLICLFILIRKKAWNYGKLSWVNKPVSLVSASIRRDTIFEEEAEPANFSEQIPLNGNKNKTFLQKVWTWVPLFIKMSDKELTERCGSDALLYCHFQRYLMLIVAVMMCFSLLLILPLNLRGGINPNSSEFGSLTIGNVTYSNNCLWAHFSVALVLMLFAFLMSNRFLNKIDVKSSEEMSSTIMIKNVPPESCEELLIQKHFQEAYPTVKVKRVQVTHKVDKLIDIYAEKMFMEEALEFCYDNLERGENPIMVVPHTCGRMMTCECYTSKKFPPVNGVEYYSAEVITLSNKFVEEKTRVINDYKLPIVFVTFENVQDALLIRRDYAYQNYNCIDKGPSHISSLSKELKSSQWKIIFAPMSHDIIWQNLHKQGWRWWIPVILANLVVVLAVFLLSTPSMVLNLLQTMGIKETLSTLKDPIVAQVIPSLILVLVNSLMPVLIYWSDQLSGHWTNTSQTKSVMNKLYTVLVMTVLILPSLGLNGFPQLFKWVFVPPVNTTYPDKFKWECIFMPDGGALFCNYLISASFIGTGLELIRFGELFLYSCRICCSKSRAEDNSIAKKLLWEFQVGLGYAWTLALFTMVSAYAVIVPIITPFGLTYLVLKHLVDRYNMIHVNTPPVVNSSVHANAAQIMQVGLVLTQATVTVYVSLRRGIHDPLSICCYLAFILGLLLTFGRAAKRGILSMACIKYSVLPKRGDMSDLAACENITMDDEGFILVDDFRNSIFIPQQLTIEEPTNIEDVIRRKSLMTSVESPKHLSEKVSGNTAYDSVTPTFK